METWIGMEVYGMNLHHIAQRPLFPFSGLNSNNRDPHPETP